MLDRSDAEGLGRDDPGAVYPQTVGEIRNVADGAEVVLVGRRSTAWYSGAEVEPPVLVPAPGPAAPAGSAVAEVLAGVRDGHEVGEDEIVTLFSARGPEVPAVADLADELRRATVGDRVTWVRNRNINYTNVCTFKCRFCGFSKGPRSLNLRGTPYLLTLDDIADRVREAADLGATEVCLQGGIHPDFDGDYYLDVTRAVKAAAPDIHVHGFTALEVTEGAKRLGEPLADYLRRLMRAGLRTLPGTAAEILDDEVRAVLCPDKIDTDEWLDAHRTAHAVGLRSNVTIMFGSIEHPRSWARHLVRTRALQKETGGFTEFVPLPFVHMAAPIYLQHRARRGPTFREALLDARRRPHRLPGLDRQHPGLVGEARHRRGPPDAAGRRERPRRDPHGRDHLPVGRRQPRPGHGGRRVPDAGRAPRAHPRAAHHPLRARRASPGPRLSLAPLPARMAFSLPRYRTGDDDLDRRLVELLEATGADDDLDQLFEILVSGVGLARDDTDRLDLKITSAALKEMRAAFHMFAPYRHAPKVTMFGSARTHPDSPVYRQAHDFAAAMAAAGWMVVTGAGPGIMQAGMEGAGTAMSVGVSIRLPFETEANPLIAGDDKLVSMKYFFTRKLMLMKESSGFVALPGGFGTLDEILELLTLQQTGKAEPAPLVLLDTPGDHFWREWDAFVHGSLAPRAVISEADFELYEVTDDPDRAVDLLVGFYRNYHSVRWVGSRLVIRLRAEPTGAEVAELNERFGHLVRTGAIEARGPLSVERREGDELDRPRLVLDYDPYQAAMLHPLIDALNHLGSAPPVAASPDPLTGI